MFDDIVYFSSLLVCISLGGFYKKIENSEIKRNYGAGLGLLVACLICGHHIYHTIFLVWGNIIIIKCCDKRFVHQISIAYTWTYLLYLHFNLTSTKYVLWIHQTMALRLVGLAFEVNMADRSKMFQRGLSSSKMPIDDSNGLSSEPSILDIVAYSYFFIGLHKGPYYRWKIFNDHFNGPFGTLGDWRIVTEQKLKKACLYTLGYLLFTLKYSPQIYYDDNFYVNYGTDHRFLYNISQLMRHFFQCHIVLMLCTSVATEAGFGVYPAKCQPLPGYGPSVQYSFLKLVYANRIIHMTDTPGVALMQEYNFSMLKCFENEKLLIGPKMKDTVRCWDMSTQYWFWAYIYKNLTKTKASKEIKSACSFLAWTIWYGPKLQQVILSATLWVYVHLESEYSKLYNPVGSMKLSWDIGFSIMRLFCLIYLTPCFIISDTTIMLKYYNSIFWMYHIVLLSLIVVAVIINKNKEDLRL
ncbi:lysophospholipid acyltransferase 7-like isoform X2 [Galleria mellonella]|uniref:Lysophospholipid acyltransferase 7 n=1 Tax=Galleria mellonella TaxID=7137 RepID=A0ABM3MQ37_GALME|nr:lysophospholipid acyltransferase 7-like isoform X2 [Galleria mellonella]